MRHRAVHHRVRGAAMCGGLAAALFAWGGPARAGFAVCNDSFDVLNLAVAYDPGGGFVSEGWWTVAPNRCVTVIRDRIRSRYVYVFATDVFNQALIAGDAPFCVDDARFRIPGTGACWTRGHVAAGFAEVDIGEAEHWTLILDGSGAAPRD